MKKVILFAMGAMIMMPSIAFAADKDKDAAAESKDPGDKWVCKVQKMTGSLTRSKRICMKASEWDKLYAQTADNNNKFISESQQPGRQARDSQTGPGF